MHSEASCKTALKWLGFCVLLFNFISSQGFPCWGEWRESSLTSRKFAHSPPPRKITSPQTGPPPPPPTKFPFLFLFFCISCSALQELFNSRLQNLVVTIVPLLPRYCKLEMAGTIFCYHQYFYLTKQCHKSVSLKKNKLSQY